MPHKRAKRSVRESEKEKKGRDLAPQTHASSSSYAEDTPKGAARIINAAKIQADYRERRALAADGKAGGRVKGKGRADNKAQDARGGRTEGNNSKSGKSLAAPTIMPGESIGAFNRRLEAHMRPLVSQAIKDAAAREKAEEREIWMEKKRRREEEKEKRRAKAEAEGSGKGKGAEEEDGQGEGKKRKRMWAEIKAGKEEEEADEEDAPPKKSKAASKPGKPEDKPSSSGKTASASTGFAPIPAPLPLHDIAMAPPILPNMRRANQQAAPSHFAVTGRTPLSAGQKRLMEEERERVVQRYREMKEAKLAEREAEREAERRKGAPKARKVTA